MSIDEREFTELYNSKYNLVFSVALRIVKDHARAQEVVQETMIKLYKQDNYEELRERIDPWLACVCKNNALKAIRNDYRSTPFDTVAQDVHSFDASPVELIMNREIKSDDLAAIANALAKLTPREREIIQLRYYKNMKYDEIAKTLGISIGNVGFIISTAKQTMKSICRDTVKPKRN